MFTISIRRKVLVYIRSKVAWLMVQFSAKTAIRWRTRATATIRSLEARPDRCPLADEAADLGLDLRELNFGRGGTSTACCSPSTATRCSFTASATPPRAVSKPATCDRPGLLPTWYTDSVSVLV